ncbi:MAG: hypothetical protein JJ921_14225 [Pseudomonadales bacterium]|nr:hypothetical protein [Pseudomonadales bacterium]MBO7004598.1 hypothetical protein [Pseudomonadales bacterium]
MIRVVFLSFLLITGCASTEPVKDASEVDGTYFDSLFDSEFFAANADPFQEMHRIIETKAVEIEQAKRYLGQFNSWYWDRYGEFPAENIHYKDEDATLTITIYMDSSENPKVNLKLEDDVLTMTGVLIRKNTWSETSRKLGQKFPMPPGLDRTSIFSWKNGEAFNIRIEKT